MNIKKTNKFKALSINIVGCLCISSLINAQAQAQAQQVVTERTTDIEVSYLESTNELNDYILDTGDRLNINFINAPELSGFYTINEQGEIYFERLKYAFVRGLTIKELTQLLEERYKEFLLNPEIYIRIDQFKPIRVAVKGEVRSPGMIKFPSFTSTNIKTILDPLDRKTSDLYYDNLTKNSNRSSILPSSKDIISNLNSQRISTLDIKRDNDYITTLSNAIQGAGGLTSYSDISKIEIVRDIPIGNGGGKKRAIIDFQSYIKNADTSKDIRLFDGDSIFIPKLQTKDPTIISNSILSGLSPRFMTVAISGEIENPGTIEIPIEGTLSDLIDLTGPRSPLSGKVFLLRYNQDGTLTRRNINYSSRATPGSSQNPYLLSGDILTVKSSILGRSTKTLGEITQPFVGIYTTKTLYESLTKN
ncbi:polysaccharide biosynthesis/export family protein [Prochlorococcus sp. MIT 1011]|uniref:polysaccharide biosynthesis/export family protein n=1 Tax=Prochlorococcus sp. MIT 1011 TaxID=3082520 RepID=UPI0039B55FBF